jgi:hypothetical protein
VNLMSVLQATIEFFRDAVGLDGLAGDVILKCSLRQSHLLHQLCKAGVGTYGVE